MAVVRLGPDDWQVYRDVRLAALTESPQWFGSNLDRATRFDEDDWRIRTARASVAVVDDRPAGVVAWDWIEEPVDADLVAMWVSPTVRGRGVGAQLVQAVVDEVVGELGADLALGVVADNVAAIGVYRRAGFVDDGEEIGAFSGDRLLRMRFSGRPPRTANDQ